MFLKALFFLPSIALSAFGRLLTFRPDRYRPSTEQEREVSQYLRNLFRQAEYRAKRLLLTKK